MEEDSYNDTTDTMSSNYCSFITNDTVNNVNNVNNESNVPWVKTNCNYHQDPVTLEPYEQSSVDNNDLFVIKTLDSSGKRFTNISTCNLKSTLMTLLLSDRNKKRINNDAPSMIKCVYDKPAQRFIDRNDLNALSNGICCKPTDIFIIKVNDLLITLQSFIDLISTDIQIWYALPLYSGKKKRIGNVYGIRGVSMDHGQIPGSHIYKLYTKEQILSSVVPKETNLYPLNNFIFFSNKTINYTDVRDLIKDVTEIDYISVNRMIDILTKLYINNKSKSQTKYNYIFSKTNPSDYSLDDIKFLINKSNNSFLPHWLHPNAITTNTIDRYGDIHEIGYYTMMDKDIKPIIPSSNLLNSSSQMKYILQPNHNISNEEFINLRNQQPQQPQQPQQLRRFNIFSRINPQSDQERAQQYRLDQQRLIEQERLNRIQRVQRTQQQEAEQRIIRTREQRCKPDQEINETTGRCRKKCSPIQVRDERTGRCKKSPQTTLQRRVRCKPDQEINETTRRCRKKCSPIQVRDERTGRCKKRN